MQADIRVGRRWAFLIMTGDDESLRSKPQSYHSHFGCKIDQENKIKFIPWVIDKSFTQKIGNIPPTIRSNNKPNLVIEISNEEYWKKLPTKNSLCFPQFQERVKVEIFACNKVYWTQGLIHIHEYNITDIDDCGWELKKEYSLSDL